LEAICSAFTNTKIPEPCFKYGIYQKPNVVIVSNEGLTFIVVFMIILAVVVLNILIICACRIYMRRKMQARMESDSLDDKISSTVTSYMALRDKH
jgi:uncharacterized membrane protein